MASVSKRVRLVLGFGIFVALIALGLVWRNGVGEALLTALAVLVGAGLVALGAAWIERNAARSK